MWFISVSRTMILLQILDFLKSLRDVSGVVVKFLSLRWGRNHVGEGRTAFV